MGFAPFDGVVLDDLRSPVPGALALLFHERVERACARDQHRPELDVRALEARAQACQELLSHGLGPERLRALAAHGLELGSPRAPHALAAVVMHLEAYLSLVAHSGYLEPDAALWKAMDLEQAGQRAVWVERDPALDGPLEVGLRDLAPARLRLLTGLTRLGPVCFRLATRKGSGVSGLFGSTQPVVDWLLEGLEEHGPQLPQEPSLAEPLGWTDAPWADALDGLFDQPLDLTPWAAVFQRGLVESPFDLSRHAVEQIQAWLREGIAPETITVVHPAPERMAPTLQVLLAAEGTSLHLRGGLRPLMQSEAWGPLWEVLLGVAHLDPARLAAGLGSSESPDLRAWAESLAQADQNGREAVLASLAPLSPYARERGLALWHILEPWRSDVRPARSWAEALLDLRSRLKLGGDAEAFFAPHALLQEAWDDRPWDLDSMLRALRLFLQGAKDSRVPRAAAGVRLVAPATLVDDWQGARATLVLDLSEGAWPAPPPSNPDLDWNRKAAINQALMAAHRAAPQATPFPLPLQRFWLPRCEAGETLPRIFQREAYAFNKLLALTRERLVVLSPAQDDAGRPKAQGPFWNALDGAAAWNPDPTTAFSRLRWAWEGHERDPLASARAEAAAARPPLEALSALAPEADRIPHRMEAWLDAEGSTSPTALQELSACPFQSWAKRVLKLVPYDPASRMAMTVGTLAHALLEHSLRPALGAAHWPHAYRQHHHLPNAPTPQDLEAHLSALWQSQQQAWLTTLPEVPELLLPDLLAQVEALLPHLAAYLAADVATEGPTRSEIQLVHPEWDVPKRGAYPLSEGWTRTLVGLEFDLSPLILDLGGASLAIRGTADRVERWEHPEGQAFIRITDYKSSRKSSIAAYSKGEGPFANHCQTPLYAAMAEAQWGLPATAVLVPLREASPAPDGTVMTRLFESDPPWRVRLQDRLGKVWQRACSGHFPPTPGTACDHCDLALLCGRPVDVIALEDEDADGGDE